MMCQIVCLTDFQMLTCTAHLPHSTEKETSYFHLTLRGRHCPPPVILTTVITSRSFKNVLSVISSSLAMKYALSVGNLWRKRELSKDHKHGCWEMEVCVMKCIEMDEVM